MAVDMIDFDLLLQWFVQLLIAFVSTLAFSFIFHTPHKQRIFIGITGGLGWITYVAASFFGIETAVASFIAALVITWISRLCAFHRKEPITTFLICGIFPIVPGAGIYYTGYYLFMGENALGAGKGFETLKIAIAIALGIGIVSSLPRFLFIGGRKKQERKKEAEK